MLVLDQSLEFAIQDIVEELDPDSPEATLLCEYAGAPFAEVADQLLEILGLASDELDSAAHKIAARIGLPRMAVAVACLEGLLKTKRVDLGSAHIDRLCLRSAKSNDN